MTKVLYFVSDDQLEILDGEIKDGVVYVPKRDLAFYVENVPKLNLITRKLLRQVSEPLFIATYDCVVPARVIRIPLNQNNVKISFEFKKDKMNNPESFYKIMNLKILGNMLKPKVNLSTVFMLLIGLALGVLIMYLLVNFGFIAVRPVPTRVV